MARALTEPPGHATIREGGAGDGHGDSGESWCRNAGHGLRQHGRHADARRREATLNSLNRHAVMEGTEWRKFIDAVRDLSDDRHRTLGHFDI